MIKVQVLEHNGLCRGFSCKGHADYAEEGADIVCAGVSAIVISTVNTLQDLLHEDLDLSYDEKNGGDISVRFREDPCEKAQFLIEHMVYGLEWIQRQYGKKYLRYEIKEV